MVDDRGPVGVVAGIVGSRRDADGQQRQPDRTARDEERPPHGSIPEFAAIGASPLSGSDCSDIVAPCEFASVAIGGATSELRPAGDAIMKPTAMAAAAAIPAIDVRTPRAMPPYVPPRTRRPPRPRARRRVRRRTPRAVRGAAARARARARRADLLEDLSPLGVGREARLDGDAFVIGALTVEVRRQDLFGEGVGIHDSAVRRRRRPRWMRERTVPTGMPCAPAISSYDRPTTSAQHDGGAELLGQRGRARPAPRPRALRSPRRRRPSGGSTRSGCSGSATVGRRRLRRTSSRNTFVTIRANHPSNEPG